MSNENEYEMAAERALDALADNGPADDDDYDVVGFAAYIKFDGVDGESKDKDHKGWSDLMSFGQAIHTPIAQIGDVRDPFRT